ncbi:VTT domain-containing protein [Photobacterium sp. MCCC 1A19761]|uniref:TVP38/TMEM64 family protein n=1 Tax=Photobacterium sp. MCCC 1A19761 TaxID=3115000 RepID=UPI00307E775E
MKVVKVLVLIALMIGIYAESNSDLWQHISDQNWIAAYITDNGMSGTLILVLFGALFTGCGGPRQLIAFTFGFAFGWFTGFLLCLLSTILSAMGCYWLAHLMLKSALNRYFGHRYQRFQLFVRKQPFIKVLIVRLFPVGSNLLTNLFSGAAGVPVKPFVTASLLGYIPQTLIFALAGSGLGGAHQYQLVASLFLGMISLLLTHYLYQRYKKNHSAVV